MNNLLKTVLPVIAIFSTFSLNNTYAQNEENVMNKEIDNAVDEINNKIDNMNRISQMLRNSIGQNQYNNMNLQSIEDHLQLVCDVTSSLWFLKQSMTDLHNYHGKNLNGNAQRLLSEYIGQYFEIMNLLKEIL